MQLSVRSSNLCQAFYFLKPPHVCLQLMCAIARMGLDLLKSGQGGLSTLICMASCSSKDAE